jgi:outer membrane protein
MMRISGKSARGRTVFCPEFAQTCAICGDIKRSGGMMNKIALVGILGVSLLIFAASEVVAEETVGKVGKIGIVDLSRAVNESEQGKKAKAELEVVVKKKQEALDEKGKALEKLKAEIEKQGSVMSAEARKNKEDDLDRLTREYQRGLTDSQTEVRKKESELTGNIVKELRRIINDVANEEKYDLVLDNNPALVAYVNKGIDITDEVIKKLDELRGKSVNK